MKRGEEGLQLGGAVGGEGRLLHHQPADAEESVEEGGQVVLAPEASADGGQLDERGEQLDERLEHLGHREGERGSRRGREGEGERRQRS